MKNHETDERWMAVALSEARKGVGLTSPNPAVGAVLVDRERLLAVGSHAGPGLPHAEIDCLSKVSGAVPRSGVLYVTLEPCSTIGRTGACTEAIIRAGIRNVVVGATDPNPRHVGRGLEILRKAGIEVRSGVLAEACAALNEAFNKWIVTGLPFVIAKCGMSLDGRLTRPPGESSWLTNVASRRHSHQLRAEVDAILIGAGTLRADNPHLTVRATGSAKQPRRVVLTRSGRLPRESRVFTDAHADSTCVYKDKSLKDVLAHLGSQEVTSVLIEGGGDVLGQALDSQLIDKVVIFVAPLFTGGPTVAFGGVGAATTSKSARLERVTYIQLEDDVSISGYPIYETSGANNSRNFSS